MRIGTASRRAGSESESEAGATTTSRAVRRMLELAEPLEPIEVSLLEAVGLVLAEPPEADVDLPPFDRAATAGYAVRADDAATGTLLRVAMPWADDGQEIEPGETAWVERGGAMPTGADAVLDPAQVRADPAEGSARVVEVLQPTQPGRAVTRRGATLAAGATLVEAGTRLRPALVALLAAQGCVHPVCHRRVRVAVVAVGDHLVGPADEPVLHHERNAGNLAVAAVLLAAEAMIHDLGGVARADFAPALARGLNSHVVLVLGRPDAYVDDTLAAAGVETVVASVDLEPGGGDVRYGVVRDADGRVASHVLRLPIDPAAAVAATVVLVAPLVARLQGEIEAAPRLLVAWDGPRPTDFGGTLAVASILTQRPDGRLAAAPAAIGRDADLPDLARASGFAIVRAGGGGLVEFVPIGRELALTA